MNCVIRGQFYKGVCIRKKTFYGNFPVIPISPADNWHKISEPGFVVYRKCFD